LNADRKVRVQGFSLGFPIAPLCRILYNPAVEIPPRKLRFCGSSRADLRSFPEDVRREAGQQLFHVQLGETPDDWKPMETVGPGVREIRIRDESGVFRVMYVAKFDEAIYVLHCFQKKTQKTAPGDLALAKRRYNELVRELGR
jgi:phage-related protein